MAKVYITRDLKTYTNGRFEIALQGESIKDIVGNLLKEHKDLESHIYTNDGKLKNYVNIYLNEKNINIRIISKKLSINYSIYINLLININNALKNVLRFIKKKNRRRTLFK